MIKPTLGRVLWLNPHPSAGITEQQTAIIAKVNEDGSLNLAVFAPDGTTYAMQNVPLVQEGETIPQSAYAQWMPYQIGQAAKTEAVLAGNVPSTSEASASSGITASDSTNTTDSGNVSAASSQVSNDSQTATSSTASAGAEPAHETIIEKIEEAAGEAIHKIEDVL